MIKVEIVAYNKTIWLGELPCIPRKGDKIVYGQTPIQGIFPRGTIRSIQWLFHKNPVIVVIYV